MDDTVAGLGKGSRVWYKQDAATWLLADIKDASDSALSVQVVQSGKVLTGLQDGQGVLVPANPPVQQAIADLTQLTYLNEPSILDNLTQRYKAENIYTNAGPVLIAVNPCKNLPLYTAEVAQEYKGAAHEATKSLPPHIFQVAGAAFRDMVRQNTSQSLVINGESGAGKTETTKKAMQFFAKLAGGTGVEDQVLETNPILEAFGNAKTLRNHNSSRFGKLIEIHFNKTNHICGARIRTYLLEKSRVVHQLKGERSFHIFYQLVRGAAKEKALQKELKLPNKPNEFVYLSKSGCMDIDGVDDAADFKEVLSALSDIGVQQGDIDMLLRTLSGILWLGNLKIEPVHADDSSRIKGDAALSNAAQLLGLEEKDLAYAITHKEIKTRDELIVKPLTAREAGDARDALAKALYAGVFRWVVLAINAKLNMGKKSSGRFIAILDIYGFEQFQTNSFEQLCINFANERLQQQFTHDLLAREQEVYAAEGVAWTKVQWHDNQACVDAIGATSPSKPMSVLAVLNDLCRFPDKSDATFMDELRDKMVPHSPFSVKECKPDEFTIQHYAGRVKYQAHGFLDKNRDPLSRDLLGLMAASSSSLVMSIGEAAQEAQAKADAARKSGSSHTVSSRFSEQLRELVSMLDATGLHFVRCIKPNAALAPGQLSTELVLQQLRCCGVLEVARVSRAGYPTRYRYEDFVSRYQVLLTPEQHAALCSTALPPEQRARKTAERLLSVFGIRDGQYKEGKTQLFLKPGVLGKVEDTWAKLHGAVLQLQALWRMKPARKHFLHIRAASVQLQSLWRAHTARSQLHSLRQRAAAMTLQAAYRGLTARREHARLCSAAVTLQAAYRALAARQECARLRAEEAALLERARAEALAAQQASSSGGVLLDAIRQQQGGSGGGLDQDSRAADRALADVVRWHLGGNCQPDQLEAALCIAGTCWQQLGDDLSQEFLPQLLQMGDACHQAGLEEPAQLYSKLQLAEAAAGASSPEDVAAALELQRVVLKAAGPAATHQQVAAALRLQSAAEEQGIQEASGLQAALAAAAKMKPPAAAAGSNGAAVAAAQYSADLGSVAAAAGITDPEELRVALTTYGYLRPLLDEHGGDPKTAFRAGAMYKAAVKHGINERADFLTAAVLYDVLRQQGITAVSELQLALEIYTTMRSQFINTADLRKAAAAATAPSGIGSSRQRPPVPRPPQPYKPMNHAGQAGPSSGNQPAPLGSSQPARGSSSSDASVIVADQSSAKRTGSVSFAVEEVAADDDSAPAGRAVGKKPTKVSAFKRLFG